MRERRKVWLLRPWCWAKGRVCSKTGSSEHLYILLPYNLTPRNTAQEYNSKERHNNLHKDQLHENTIRIIGSTLNFH